MALRGFDVRRVPEDRRQEEPGQQRGGEDVLDVAEEHVEGGDQQGEAGDEADEEQADWDREPDGRAC